MKKNKLKDKIESDISTPLNIETFNFLIDGITVEYFNIEECGDTLWDKVLEQEELREALKLKT